LQLYNETEIKLSVAELEQIERAVQVIADVLKCKVYRVFLNPLKSLADGTVDRTRFGNANLIFDRYSRQGSGP